MKLDNMLNVERVSALRVDGNAYINNNKSEQNKVGVSSAEKVIFPQPYENAGNYYNKNNFSSNYASQNCNEKSDCEKNKNFSSNRGFNFQSVLPMLMGGQFNDILKPLMSMFGGKTGSMDFAKIFELFKSKPKSKSKTVENKNEELSRFDDFIIIED